MSKNDETMTKEEIAQAVQEHGGDMSMTLMDSLKPLVENGKVKMVATTKPSKTVKAKEVVPAVTPKFSFQRPVALPAVQKFLSKEEQEKLIEEERQRRAVKAKALADFADQIGPWMPDLVVALRAYAAMSEEAKELAENKERELSNRKMLADALNQEDPDAQAIAVKAFAASFVLTCPKRKRDVQDVVDRLVNYDFLKKTERRGEGIILVYESGVELAAKFQDDLQAKEIFRDFRNLVRETKESGREFYRSLEEAFEAKNTEPLSLENLLAMVYGDHAEKKSGTIVLENPAHEEKGRDGEVRSYRGGKILYGVSDNKICAIDGLGGTQKVAQNLADAGTFVFLNQLREERIRFSDNMSEGARKAVALFHKLVRIGIRTMREKAEKDANEKTAAEAKAKAEAEFTKERTEVLAMAGDIPVLSPEEFLLQEKTGAMMLDNLPDPWVRKDKGTKDGVGTVTVTEYRHPENALVIRGEDGKIRVVCPSRLATLYQGAQDVSYPGDKFTGLVYPLGGMLRTMWSVTKGAKDEALRKAKSEAAKTETGTEAQ